MRAASLIEFASLAAAIAVLVDERDPSRISNRLD
jgi:hypothetical protein